MLVTRKNVLRMLGRAPRGLPAEALADELAGPRGQPRDLRRYTRRVQLLLHGAARRGEVVPNDDGWRLVPAGNR
jgi:hypothetical protein